MAEDESKVKTRGQVAVMKPGWRCDELSHGLGHSVWNLEMSLVYWLYLQIMSRPTSREPKHMQQFGMRQKHRLTLPRCCSWILLWALWSHVNCATWRLAYARRMMKTRSVLKASFPSSHCVGCCALPLGWDSSGVAISAQRQSSINGLCGSLTGFLCAYLVCRSGGEGGGSFSC